MKTQLTSLVVLAAAVLPALQAGEEPAVFGPDPVFAQEAPEPGGWQFSLSPYLWTAGLKGRAGVDPLVAPVDADFGDIWDNLDLAFLAAAELRYDRWALLANLTWLDLSTSDGNGGLRYDSVSVDLQQTILDARVAYRVLEGRTNFDLIAGARYMAIDTDIAFSGGLLGGSAAGISEDWIDPLIGFRLVHEFNETWLGVLRADVGGFGVSSDLIWEVFAGVGYRITESTTLFAGYRFLDVDYDRDFVLDAEIQGIVLGAQFNF